MDTPGRYALRQKALDLDNLLEEREGMGKSPQQQLQRRLEILRVHLFKWPFQPKCRVPVGG